MELNLRNIQYYGDNNSRIVISVEVHYGWEENHFAEIVKISYHTIKKNPTITVKAKNPGISLVIKRMIEVLNKINFESDKIKNPAAIIITELHAELKMTFEEEMIDKTIENWDEYYQDELAPPPLNEPPPPEYEDEEELQKLLELYDEELVEL